MPWSPMATFICVLLSLLGLLIISMSALAWLRPSLCEKSKDAPLLRLLVANFALQKTVPALLKTGAERSGRLAALNGVRVLSMSWVILGHTVIFQNYSPGFSNGAAIANPSGALGTAAFQLIPSAEFAVDSFFVLSGFLGAYLFTKQVRKLCARPSAGRRAAAEDSASASPYGYVRGEDMRVQVQLSSRNSINGEQAKPLLEAMALTDQGTATAITLPSPMDASQGKPVSSARKPRGLACELSVAVLVAYLHRWLRIAPVLAVLIGFYGWVIPTLETGPFWQWTAMQGQCASHWWTNLLFINTNIPGDDNFDTQCMGWTWFLSNDFQLFLALPVFVLLFAWRPVAGWAAVCLAVCASLAGSGYEVWTQHLNTTLASMDGVAEGDYSNLFYAKSWMRAPAYLIGVGLAFWLLHRDDREAAAARAEGSEDEPTEGRAGGADAKPARLLHRWLPANMQWLPLALPLVAMGLLTYLPVGAYQGQYTPWSPDRIYFYTWASRPMWSLSLAALLYACFTGGGGTVGSLLGHPAWEPLARLTFGAYLVHPMVMQYWYMQSRSLMYFSPANIAFYYIANAAFAHVVAAVVFVVLEYPIGGLEKALFQALGLK